jgi:hypothetical protein
MKFNIPERLIKERDGAHYNLACYLKDTDYVARRAFKGVKFMFRADILDLNTDLSVKNSAKNDLSDLSDDHIALSVVDPSLVEHKQDMEPIIIRPAFLDGSVRAARVVKKHANQRFVETDTLGRVFVGEKGHQIKVSQIINVKDGVLFLAKVATLPIH